MIPLLLLAALAAAPSARPRAEPASLPSPSPSPRQPEYAAARAAASAAALLDPSAPDWRGAASIAWGPAPYRTRFRALWSAAGLHLRFEADDDDPWHTMTRRDDPIWEEEAVEIFLDAERDGRYIEVELSPANVVCDLRRAAPGAVSSDPIPVPSGVMDRGFRVAGLQTAVTRTPTGWTGTLFLPWPGLGLVEAPEAGTEMPFNVFRIERPGGPSAPEEGAVFAAWSDTGSPSFHVPEAFRPLRLAPPPPGPSP